MMGRDVVLLSIVCRFLPLSLFSWLDRHESDQLARVRGTPVAQLGEGMQCSTCGWSGRGSADDCVIYEITTMHAESLISFSPIFSSLPEYMKHQE